MSATSQVLDITQHTITDKPLTMKELAFIAAYISNGGNGTQAVKQAGYQGKTENAYAKQSARGAGEKEEMKGCEL